MDYASQLNGRYPVIKYGEINGAHKMLDWLCLGPFVLKTDGMMETEYLYERHKLLDEDYLASSGGESGAAPYFGKKQKNDYYGEAELAWHDVSFMHGVFNLQTGNATYATAQRNCVWYAAYYIECEKPETAVLTFDHSGAMLYVNGELVHNEPYGRVKGLGKMPRTVAVSLNKGLNLVMFKIRVGFIADGLDLTVKDNYIHTKYAECGGLVFSQPIPSSKFFGPASKPKQVWFINAAALKDTDAGEIKITAGKFSQTFELPALKKGQNKFIRLPVPASVEAADFDAQLEIKCGKDAVKKEFTGKTLAFHGFDGTEIIYTNFHFDTTYYQEQRVYGYGAIDIARRFVEYFKQNPKFKGILSEVDYLHPYYSVFPEDREYFKKLFVEGRAESDCFYNQPNEMTSSPEGFVRNMVYGQIYHRDVLGRICSVYSPEDVFGHPNQMSQICAKGGCDALSWSKGIFGFPPVFRHISPDGTSLLTRKGGVPMSAAREYGTKTILNWEDFLSGMTAFPREPDTTWMDEYVPRAMFGLPSDVTKNMTADETEHIKQTGKPSFPYTSRDMSLYHAGVSLSRMDLKTGNRLGENLLISAEKFSVIASVLGARYPEKALDKAWRQLLCGQHHDSITGTHNEVSFVDLMTGYRESAEMAAEIIRDATAYIASSVVAEKDGAPVVLFNTHAFKRTGPAFIDLTLDEPFENYIFTDEKGKKLPAQAICEVADGKNYKIRAAVTAELPSMGYTAVYLKKGIGSKAENCSDNVIENEFYRVTADPALGGGIVSIFDKKAGREVLKNGCDGPANRIVAMKEVRNRLEESHEFYTDGHRMYSTDAKAEVTAQKGAAFERITVSGALGQIAKTKQEITLWRGVKRIDFKTSIIDFRGDDELMTVTFPVDLKGARATFDDRFSQAVRCESRGKLDFRTHQHMMYSHCSVYAANQWLDYGPSTTVILNDAGEASKINLGMTALVAPSSSRYDAPAHELMLALTKKCLPVTLYPDGDQSQIGGRIKNFNTDLHNTDSRFVLDIQNKNLYAQKLRELAGAQKSAQLDAEIEKTGYAFMLVTDTDNAWKKPVDVILVSAQNAAMLKKAVKKLCGLFEKSEKISVEGVVCGKARKADDYGVAVINTGNLACSVENGGMLSMMLFHTAEWYGSTDRINPKGFLPEKKTHVFTYALYPHEGDYREAGVIRAGLELNDPIISSSGFKTDKKAFMPQSYSFMQTSDNIILTALKAGGYPAAAMKKGGEDIIKRGLALRYYEPHGASGRAWVKFTPPVDGVRAVNMLEEGDSGIEIKNGKASFGLRPYTIDTLTASLSKQPAALAPKDLGAQKEIVQPVFLRSWEHDAGTMPIGFMAVAGAIGRKLTYISDKKTSTIVSMANNRGGERIKGVMKLEIPHGWKTNAAEFAYDVAPAGVQTFPLEITRPEADAKGIIRLFYEDDGQTFTDILEIGCFEPSLLIRIDDDAVVCSVTNETPQRLCGELAIASPVETWACGGHNPDALIEIGPRTCAVDVAPGTNCEYRFPIEKRSETLCAFWAVAKLMINGRIYFKYADKQGRDHHWDTLKYGAYGVPEGKDYYETYIEWDK